MANRQSIRLTAGEDRTITLTATNPDGSAMDLTGASINWTLARLKGNAPSLVKTGTILSAADGTFTISISAGDTNLLRAATYFHQALITIGGSVKNGVEGNAVVTAENQSILATSAGAVFNNNQFYGTRAEAILTKISTNPSFVETFGYYTVGDGGGGKYKRVGSAPAINEYFQSADGAYWELILEGTLNVRQFGAKGDGSDDAAAIAKPFSYLRSLGAASTSVPAWFVEFPPGDFTVLTTINATSIRNLTWGIRGPGVIVGQTNGTPILDLTDSRYCAVNDLSVIGSTTRTPNVGILCAVAGQVADEHNFTNVSIDGSFTLAGLYNYGSEDFNGSDVISRNNQNTSTSYCVVLTGYNSMGVTSPYKTIAANSATSFNDFYLIHGDFRKTATGTPIFIERSDSLELVSSYAVSVDSPGCIVRAADSFGNEGLHLDVHFETSGLTDCVQFTSYTTTATINGFRFRDYAPQASTSIFKGSSGVTVTVKDIDVTIDRFAVALTNFLWYANGGALTLLGGRVQIPDTTYLNNVGKGIRYTFRDGTLATYGVVGINQASPTGSLEIASASAQLTTNSGVSRQLRLTKLTTGTPSAGIGVGIETIVQTAASNFELASAVDVISTDVTGASEDFDMSFSLMAGGASAAEKFRILSTGTVQFGTHTGKGAEAFSGYIIIKDAAGNDRKVMVCS